MPTQCIHAELDLGRSASRKHVGAFDGGAITSNGGAVLLAGAERRLRFAERLVACFTELSAAEAIKHGLPDRLRQRIFGLALGYEDLFDLDALRFDPALAAVIDLPEARFQHELPEARLRHDAKPAGARRQDRPPSRG